MIGKQDNGFIKDAIYISYTSISDFLKCPRTYYLKNIYRNPENNYKLQIASPYISLGAAVHDSVEWFLAQDFTSPIGGPSLEELIKKYRNFWLKFHKKRGGFSTLEEEGTFGKRGIVMLENFYKNWKVLPPKERHLNFPKYNLLNNVILIGNFDYVGILPDGSLQIVDFKTGANDQQDTTQLDIYAILAEANFQKPVSEAAFWYLDRDDAPRQIVLDPLEPKIELLKEKAKEIKKAIEVGEWVCSKQGPSTRSASSGQCRDCTDYQAILDGKGEFQFSDNKFKKDVYYLDKSN